MGDFNYRCELHANEADKGRGGKDWVAVNGEAASGDNRRLENLFFRADRLQRWMQKKGVWEERALEFKDDETNNFSTPAENDEENSFDGGEESVPSILVKTIDAISAKIGSPNSSSFPAPTFTFDVGAAPPRPYSKKRTPSWTDRILLGGLELRDVGTEQSVTISDHDPIFSFLTLPLPSKYQSNN